MWDLQVKPSVLCRGSLLQAKDTCLRARLIQDNTQHMFFLLTMGAGHLRVILYMLTVHRYTDQEIFPTAIPRTEGCRYSKWDLKVHAQPYRRLSPIFSVFFFLIFSPYNIQVQEYFQTINA